MKNRVGIFIMGLALLLVSCSKFPLFQDDTFTDTRDNHVYKLVKIGDQTWMAENLAFLPAVSPSSEGSDSIPFYYVYDYQSTSTDAAETTGNYNAYGVLYNWAAAKISCPSGWHLPEDREWQVLSDYLDKNWLTVGNKMKETGTSHWNGPNDKATNKSGFTGLPGGERSVSGGFNGIGNYGEFWSETIEYPPFIKIRMLITDLEVLAANHFDRENGFSVRCIK